MWDASEGGDQLREIIARTTCAKGQEKVEIRETLIPEHTPDNILGVLVTNHSYTAVPKEEQVQISGQFDLHTWYSYDAGRQTAVIKKAVHYTANIPVTPLDGGRLGKDEEARAKILYEPRVRDAFITAGGDIQVLVTTAYCAEIIGEARLWIKVYCPPPEAKECDDEDEDVSLEDDIFDDEDIEEEPAGIR